MNWRCEFTANAEQDLRSLPKPIQKRVARVLNQMAFDPFSVTSRVSAARIGKAYSDVELGTLGCCSPRSLRRG
jgi:mRNA-degrading endonuclease RelE of RelBE toxin-antitoxin system